MRHEKLLDLAMGAAIAVCAFLAWRGVNIWPAVILGALIYVLLYTTPEVARGRKFVTVFEECAMPDVTFEDIGGQAPAKGELLEALEFLTDLDGTRKLGIRPLKGIMLAGPPGTGKTMLAKAAARHTNSVFLSTSGSEFVEVYAGIGARRVRDLFRHARELARRKNKKSAVIFIDELEVLGGWRGRHAGHLEYDQTLNQFPVM